MMWTLLYLFPYNDRDKGHKYDDENKWMETLYLYNNRDKDINMMGALPIWL